MSKSQDFSHARQVQSKKKTERKNRKKKPGNKEKFVTRVKEFHIEV